MEGLMNTLKVINENWSNIVIIISTIIVLVNKVKKYFAMSKEERVESALKVVKTELLKIMSDAEVEWNEFEKSGELKKSQVIKSIYEQFPILNDYIDQDKLIEKINDMIEDQLKSVDKIINNINEDEEE